MFTNRHPPVLPQLPPHQYTFFFQIWIVILSKHSLTLPTPNPTPAQKIYFFFQILIILIVDPTPPFRPFFFFRFEIFVNLSKYSLHHFTSPPPPPPPPPKKKNPKKQTIWILWQFKKKFIRPAPPRPAYNFFF